MTGPVSFKAACVQLRSSGDVAENIRSTSALVREAAGQGARFIATPENTNIMAENNRAKLDATFDEANDPSLPAFSALAKDLKVWLLIGSLHIKVSDTKTANRSFLFAPDGTLRAPPVLDSISSRACVSISTSTSSTRAPFFFRSDLARTQ